MQVISFSLSSMQQVPVIPHLHSQWTSKCTFRRGLVLASHLETSSQLPLAGPLILNSPLQGRATSLQVSCWILELRSRHPPCGIYKGTQHAIPWGGLEGTSPARARALLV